MWKFLPPSEPLGRITVEWDRDDYVLRLAGEIDTATVEAYEEPPLDAAVISVIDLTEVEFLGSSGLAFLVRQTQPARDRGLLPTVRGLTAQAQRILQITGAITMFQPVAEANGGRSTVRSSQREQRTAMSDSITWEPCPNCCRPAAVGWRNGSPVEFDCPAGCWVSEDEVCAFADKRRSPVEWLTRSVL